jgi:hypothetical protein
MTYRNSLTFLRMRGEIKVHSRDAGAMVMGVHDGCPSMLAAAV